MTELPEGRDLAAVERILAEALEAYGFHTFAYLCFASGADVDDVLPITSYPPGWVARYTSERYDRIDPVIARAVTTTLPFRWSAEDPEPGLSRRQAGFLEEARTYGIRQGLTIPVHDRQGKAASLTLIGDDRAAAFDARLERHRHALHLIAIYLHGHVRQTILPVRAAGARPLLTGREASCIQWAARGKSATDVAEILQISRRTVVFHIENAKQKLGVATLQQAIAQAIVHDIITV